VTKDELVELRSTCVHAGVNGLLMTSMLGTLVMASPDLWTAFVFATSAGIGVLTMRGAWRMHRKATRYLKELDHDET
jgi:hypothetical protein